MKSGWWMSVVVIWAPAAIAESVKLLPTALEIPDRIGPLAYTGKPDVWPDKRLGLSYKFTAPGVLVDIYVYDAGVPGIPEGADSRPVCEQFEQAKADVMRSGYKDVVLKGEQLARLGASHDSPLAREAVFEAVIQDSPTISYLWTTGAAGHFIKVRFSINAQLRYEVEGARRAVLNAVGDAIRPHLVKSGTTPEKKGMQVNVVMGPGTAAEQGFGLPYLVGLASLTSRTDVALPPCGGRLRPGFDAVVMTWKLALGIANKAAAKTAFTKKVAEVETAGYLEEFIWTSGHQDYWGDKPPEGLEIKAFNKWGRKRLKDVRIPIFGHVEISHVRELPLEPL
jgi:hypothetical protein